MPNTVIALKKSSTPDAVPSDLANGELALNFADGKLYYKRANGQITFIASPAQSDSFGTINANGTLIISDSTSDVLTLEQGSNIIIVGDAVNDKITISANLTLPFDRANNAFTNSQAAFAQANNAFTNSQAAFSQANTSNTTAVAAFAKANAALANATGTFDGTLTLTGDLNAVYLNSTNASGDEGGEVKLAKPPNGTLSGGIVIDAFQDRVRFFENGGSARGAFIDLKACGTGASTNLLSLSGASSITVGNTISGTYTSRSTQGTINFIPGANVSINVVDDSVNGRANVTIDAVVPGGWWAPTTSIVTGTSVSATKDTRYFLTSNSATTVTLPSTPTQGDTIYVVVTNQLANNVIARNGNKIMSLDEDLTLDITYYSIGFTYIDANLGWVII